MKIEELPDQVTNLSNITTISFDVDGTLWDFERFTRHALQQVLDELAQIDHDAAQNLTVDQMVTIRDRVHEQLWGNDTDLDTIREKSMQQALREAGRPNDSLGSYLTKIYFQRRDEARTIFPDARPALEPLARHFKLGLLSNGNSRAKVLGIEDIVSFEVFSQDHGAVDKPDPRIFEIAMHEARCQPHELLHVGDSWENDVLGALNAGATPVFFNRNPTGQAPQSVIEIGSLAELSSLLLAQPAMESR